MNNTNLNTTDLRKTEIGKLFDSKMEALELEDSPEIKAMYDQLYNMTDVSQTGNPETDSNLTDLVEKIVYEKMKQAYISGYEFALSVTLGI